MNTTRTVVCAFAASLTLLGCSERDKTLERASTPPTPVTFVNTVWTVAESNRVTPGQLYVFLSEGTLVVASERGMPSLGTWKRDDAGLVIVEQGIPHPVDIIELSETTFHVRVKGPGEPIVMRLVPATGEPFRSIETAAVGDIEARGNEPFWHIKVASTRAWVRTPEEPDGVEFGNGAWSRSAAKWIFNAERPSTGEMETITLEIEDVDCVDTMSGESYSFRAALTRHGVRMEGCGMKKDAGQ